MMLFLFFLTVHVPSEGVSQLLSIYLHVQADRNKRLHLCCILVDDGWVVVIKAKKRQEVHTTHLQKGKLSPLILKACLL